MSGQASSELRRGEEREGVGKSRGGWEASRAVFLLPLGDGFVKAFWWTLGFSLASCVLLLVSSGDSLVRINTSPFRLFSLALLRSRSLFLQPDWFLLSLFLSFFFVFPSPCPPTVGLVSEQLFSLAFCLLSKCTPACHPLRLPCIIHWGHFAGIAGWGVLSIGRCEWALLEVGATPWLETQRFFSLLLFASLAMVAHGGLVQATRRVGHSLAGRASD